MTKHWETARRFLPERYLPYPVRGGRVYLSLGNAPTYVQRLLRVYEPAKFAAVARYLPVGGGFVDVGANAGDFTVWAAHVGGPTTRVLAVEPESQNTQWLRRTVSRNGLDDRVTVVRAAASDCDGEAELLVTAKHGTHSIVETELHRQIEAFRPVRRELVPARRLDDLVAEAGLTRVDLVKIDVEGAELLVLRGATELLGRPDAPTLLVDLHFGVDLEELTALLHGQGYTLRLEESPDVVLDAIPERTLSIVAVPAQS